MTDEIQCECLQIEFNWNTDTPICLHIVLGCFYTTISELAIYNRDYM